MIEFIKQIHGFWDSVSARKLHAWKMKNKSHGRRASCIWTATFKGLQHVKFHSTKNL